MANKYYVGSGNWSTAANWRTTSGGGTATTVPTTSDTAYLDASSGDVTVDTTSATAGNIVCTNHAGTFTITASQLLTIVTSITLGSGQTLAGTGRLKMTTGAGTYTSAGLTVPWEWEFSSATGTKTLADNWTVTGCLYMSAHATINGNNLYLSGGWKSTTTTPRTLYGTVVVTLTGGEWLCTVKRTAGSVVLAGNVTFTGSNAGYSSGGVYDSSLTYSSGTITATGAFYVGGTTTLTLGSSCHLHDLDGSGTLTLGDDLYLDGTAQVSGTTSLTIKGSGGNRVIYFAEHMVMYNQGTFVNSDGTARMVAIGTGTIFRGTTLNGMTYNPSSALQIPLEINTSGTITFASAAYACRFGGLGSLTHTKGTVNFYSGAYIEAYTDSTTIDVDSGFTIPQLTVTAISNIVSPVSITVLDVANGATANGVDGVTIGTLRISGNGSYNAPNASTTTVSTALLLNGTDSLQPVISANPISLQDFFSGAGASMSPATSGSNYRRVTISSFNDVTDFTFAFDYIHTGYTGYAIIGGTDGYLWTPSSGTGSLFFFMTPSDAYYSYVGINAAKRRIVITKTLGSAMKFYVDGVSKAVSVNGSSANLVNADINFSTFASKLTGDVLFFSGTAKDATWVAEDYAAFQANGNSSAGVYDNTETDLTAGWHVDSWTNAVTNMILDYNGTNENQNIFRGDFRYVDASTSAVPIKTLFGTVNSSINVFEHDLKDIGGGGVSVTHY